MKDGDKLIEHLKRKKQEKDAAGHRLFLLLKASELHILGVDPVIRN
jgi:hypothetical protein